MARENIFERQAHVRQLIEAGRKFDAKLKKELAERYACSISAIFADVVAFTRPYTKESAFVTPLLKKKIYSRDGNTCQYCMSSTSNLYIIEHVIPAALGGVAKAYNLVVACNDCNSKKGRSVWIPANLEQIAAGHKEWKMKILSMAESEVVCNSAPEKGT